VSSLALPDEEEFCPSCGHHARLVDYTGWCPQCTIRIDPSKKICKTCGDLFPKKAQVSQCWACRKEEWLTKHADEIEKYLIAGLTVTAAIKKVADDIRPTCVCCGNKIRGGRQDARFCRKNAECEQRADQFTALKASGLSPDVALAIASGRVTVLR
jgi:hypothetical protein